jgi:hypothetical protein
MYISIKLIVLAFLSTCLNFGSNETFLENKKETQNLTAIKCGDLFSRYAEKPAKLSFVNCVSGEGQVILEAKYKVSGTDSKQVEDFLVKNYGLGKLKFACCGWESEKGKNGQINSVKGLEAYPNYSLTIIMFASAEKEGTEKEGALEFDRNKIKNFTVLVQIVDV